MHRSQRARGQRAQPSSLLRAAARSLSVVSQAGGRGIQDVIEARLSAIFKAPIRIHGSGRTDAGVHARGQVFHFDAAWPHGAGKLLAALRTGHANAKAVGEVATRRLTLAGYSPGVVKSAVAGVEVALR